MRRGFCSSSFPNRRLGGSGVRALLLMQRIEVKEMNRDMTAVCGLLGAMYPCPLRYIAGRDICGNVLPVNIY